MSPQTTTTCAKCGAENSFSDMAHFSSALFGSELKVDADGYVTNSFRIWMCHNSTKDCFNAARGDSRWRARIYHMQEQEMEKARKLVEGAQDNALDEAQRSVRGHKVSSNDITRFKSETRSRIHSRNNSDLEKLTPEDADLCYRLYQNLAKAPRYNKRRKELVPHDPE